MLKPNGPSGFGYGTSAEDVTSGLSLAGKTILVTGCNSGLGLETARVLSMRGARVFGTARTADKANEALKAFAGAVGFACELADPTSVRAAVVAITAALGSSKLDVIIANAGIMALPKNEQAFGIDLQLFTNHMGHFILITGLLDVLADDARVVMLSSSAHTMAPRGGIEFDNLSGARGYSAWKQYGQSKMANILFAKELARRFEGTKRVANAVHPGVIQTNLGRHMNPIAGFFFGLGNPLVLKDVHQGAATSCYVAVHPKTTNISGRFFADCNLATERADGSDLETAKKLWAVSEEIAARV
jgi:WW domain-containing oxidoreductase